MSRRPYRGGGAPLDNGVLSERVDGLQADFASFRSEIGSTLKALGDKFDERSRTPWGHIWSAAGVLMTVLVALGGLAFYPISQGQSALATTLKEVSDHMVSEKELQTLIASTSARRDDAQRVTEARLTRDEADTKDEVREIRDRLKGYVPTEAITMLTKQVDDLQRRFNAAHD